MPHGEVGMTRRNHQARNTGLRGGTSFQALTVSTIALGCLLASASLAIGAEPVDFQREVAPILRQRCLSCHNDRDPRGGLSLQTGEKVGKGGDSGQVIKPGDVTASYLVEVLTPTDGKAEMPKGNAPLADDEIDTIRRWITEGAAWPDGVVLKTPVLWSLQPIARPACSYSC